MRSISLFCGPYGLNKLEIFVKNQEAFWRRESRLGKQFSDDVTAAISVFQNNGTAAMVVYLDKPVGVEFFSYVKNSFDQIN